jgi:hypothetical protein
MSLKQAMVSTVGELRFGESSALAKANLENTGFENAIWTLVIKNGSRQFTTTQPFTGTINKNEPVTGTCIFTLIENVTRVETQYSLNVSLKIYPKDSFVKTVFGRLSTDVIQLIPITVDTYKITLTPSSSGPGDGFTSSFLTNYGFSVRFEWEQELSSWVLFIDNGVSLVKP